jgi:hypothetical protein
MRRFFALLPLLAIFLPSIALADCSTMACGAGQQCVSDSRITGGTACYQVCNLASGPSGGCSGTDRCVNVTGYQVCVPASSPLASGSGPTPLPNCSAGRSCPTDHTYVCVSDQCYLANGQPCTSTGQCQSGSTCSAGTAGSGSVCTAASTPVSGGTAGQSSFTSITPQLGTPIPGVTLSPATKNGEIVSVPFLAQYVNGAYRYLIGISLIAAIVMTVYGGFRYLVGSSLGDIKAGKKIITDALGGMLIILAAYLILNTINPATLNLSILQLANVDYSSVEFDNPGGIDEGTQGSTPSVPQGASDTDFDAIFQRYAGCAGLDWRVLKAVAYRESGFQPTIVNRFGFVGLFQTRADFCSLPAGQCQRLTDPDINTKSAATGILRVGAQRLTQTCPDLHDAHRFVMLLYFGHNSGPGALRSVLQTVGCNGTDSQYDQAAAQFWLDRAQARGGQPIPRYDQRMPFARTVADVAASYGVTDPVQSGSCPSS